MLTVSRDVLLKELETSRDYLANWVERIQAGIPGIDLPATGNAEEHLESFIRELCGELRVVAGKCESLSEVVAESLFPQGG